MFKSMKTRIINKNLDKNTDINRNFLWALLSINKTCSCCDKILKFNIGNPGHDSPTLDKVNPETKSYKTNNVDIIYFRCNRLKNQMVLSQIEKLISYIQTKMQEKDSCIL